MLEYPILRLFLILLLVLMNGFFTAAEFAYVRVRKSKLQELADQGSKNAKRVIDLIQDLNKITSSAQLGITLASIMLGFVGESFFTELLTIIFNFFGLGSILIKKYIHWMAFFTGYLLITFLHVVFGELIPKVLSIQMTEKVALYCALPLSWFMKATDWMLYLFIQTSNRFLALFGIDANADVHSEAFTEDELKIIIQNSIAKGELEEYESKLIFNIFEFTDQNVKEIFTPRIDIKALADTTSLEEILDMVKESGFSRIPIFRKEFDNMIGFIHIKDVIRHVSNNGIDRNEFDVSELLHNVIIAHEWKAIDELFKEMQLSKTQMAIIIDEYGLIEGLVTIEDIMESIFGPIADEFDVGDDHQGLIVKENSVLAGGLLSIGSFNETIEEKFGLSIQSDDSVTIAGYVLELFESEIPKVNQEANDGRLKYKIKKMSGNRIDLIEVKNMD